MPDFSDRKFPHLYIRKHAQQESYKTKSRLIPPAPPERNRVLHSGTLKNQIESTLHQYQFTKEGKGVYLEISLPAEHAGIVESLEGKKSKIEILTFRPSTEFASATVFMPMEEAAKLSKKIDAYASENTKAGNPRYQNLFARIARFGPGNLRSLFTDPPERFPADHQRVWWELWLRKGTEQEFFIFADSANIPRSADLVEFPERAVVLANASTEELEQALIATNSVAEVRLSHDNPAPFLSMDNAEQAEWTAELLNRVTGPPNHAPAICILDTGLNRAHPLLSVAAAAGDLHSYQTTWGVHDPDGHGTGMAGLSLYGDLTPFLLGNDNLQLSHWLESVKILNNNAPNHPRLYGQITKNGVSLAEIAAPFRERAICMAVTSIEDCTGRPTSWSAAIDQLCFGENATDIKRLFLISAGNYRYRISTADYPTRNDLEKIESPAQAWNALAVGAYTENQDIHDPAYQGWAAIAPEGCLSPASRTSVSWNRQWPIKPDLVFEGGNYADDGTGGLAIPDLSLLTTDSDLAQQHFRSFGDTSAATALASKMSAEILAAHPGLWPETVRALLVHSAEWTAGMREQGVQAGTSAEKAILLRRYGYGVPDLARALRSASSDLTLVIEDQLQPFVQIRGAGKAKEMNLHRLPWPRQELEMLGEEPVELRITLSYFIEPNPGERGWSRRHSYASHGLRFSFKRQTETLNQFRSRINAAFEAEPGGSYTPPPNENWFLGRLRNSGSVHSDIWSGTAADLATRDAIAVLPSPGWWKDNLSLGKYNSIARYALLVTVRLLNGTADIYTPVASQIAATIQIEN